MPLTKFTFWEDGSLSCELLQHFGCSSEPVPTLSNADVQAEFANAQLPHGVFLLTLVLMLQKWQGDKKDCGHGKNKPCLILIMCSLEKEQHLELRVDFMRLARLLFFGFMLQTQQNTLNASNWLLPSSP